MTKIKETSTNFANKKPLLMNARKSTLRILSEDNGHWLFVVIWLMVK